MAAQLRDLTLFELMPVFHPYADKVPAAYAEDLKIFNLCLTQASALTAKERAPRGGHEAL